MVKLSDQVKAAILEYCKGVLADKRDDTETANDIDLDISDIAAGIFVSVSLAGELKGCFGNPFPEDTNLEQLKLHVLNAAFEDKRFKPLMKAEIDEAEIEIYFLHEHKLLEPESPIEVIEVLGKTKPGVIVKEYDKMATFLPHVWDDYEQIEDFMASLCEKARLDENAWLRNAQIYTYNTEVISTRSSAG